VGPHQTAAVHGKDFRNAYAAGARRLVPGRVSGCTKRRATLPATSRTTRTWPDFHQFADSKRRAAWFLHEQQRRQWHRGVLPDIEMVISMAPGCPSSMSSRQPAPTRSCRAWPPTPKSASSALPGAWTAIRWRRIFRATGQSGSSFFMASGDGDAYVGSIWGGAMMSMSPVWVARR